MQIALPLEHPVERHSTSLAVLILAGMTVTPTSLDLYRIMSYENIYRKPVIANVQTHVSETTLDIDENNNIKDYELSDQIKETPAREESNVNPSSYAISALNVLPVETGTQTVISSRGTNVIGEISPKIELIDPGPEDKRKKVLNIALGWQGTPYLFGGQSRAGIDCSALVQKIFGEIDVNLPRTSYDQFRQGIGIPRNSLLPGDLIFFSTNGPGASHVGIYLGNATFLSATRRQVEIQSLDAPYWSNSYRGSRRILN